jgi:two-component system chemotaxis response regulator CheB
VIKLHSKEPLNHCRPAVDYLFHSAARIHGSGALALVLTGMGSDGLDGARAIHKCGGTILAQDENTSAVWGMPGRVVEAGIAGGIMSIPEMAREVNSRVSSIRPIRQQTPTPDAMLRLVCGEAAHGMY